MRGLPSYCLICGKVGYITRWRKAELLGEGASEVNTESLFAFKGLDVAYDLRGNYLAGRGDG